MPYVFASNPKRTYYKTTTTTGTTTFNKSTSNDDYATTDLGFIATSATVTITEKVAYYTVGSGEDEREKRYSPKVNVSISTNGSTWIGGGSVAGGSNGSVSITKEFRYLKIELYDKVDYGFSFKSNIALTKKIIVTGSESDYTYYIDKMETYIGKSDDENCFIEVK